MVLNGDISSLHPDILKTNILTRLDGPALAATSFTSTELQFLARDENLWRKICTSTWPSINDTRVTNVIPKFPYGYKSFFSDSYPVIYQYPNIRQEKNLDGKYNPTSGLISAVDIYYKNVPILSKVVETETESAWFQSSPLKVDVIEPKDFVNTWTRHEGDEDTWLKEVEENVTLSWIVIDPERKRAVNLSSQRPVLSHRHWLTGEIQLKFAAVVAGGGWGTAKDYVLCSVVVTCEGKEESGGVHVREVYMGMEDLEGKGVCGKDSLVILRGSMEGGVRRKGGSEREGKERFEDFLGRKVEWKVMKERKEKFLDTACIVVGVTIFVIFWCSIFLRR